MEIKSEKFDYDESIPSMYTCQGENVSPPLTWEDIPEEAESLALIMDDPDAPIGTFVHWLVWNIPTDKKEFEEDEKIDFPQGKNGYGKNEYAGPCPPFGEHRYFFKIYALDTTLDLSEESKKKDLEKSMKGHIVEKAESMGKFKK